MLDNVVKVIVADDSRITRRVLRDLLESDPRIKVVGEASNGIEAIDLVMRLKPDVVIMDVVMPRMDGITAIKEIMKIRPTPIIVFSPVTKEGSEAAIEAIEAGALDVISKPGGSPIVFDLGELGRELRTKVKVLARLGPLRLAMKHAILSKPAEDVETKPFIGFRRSPELAIVIAASTGGPSALARLLPQIEPNNHVSLLIVQHMPPLFTKSLAERLNKTTGFIIEEADDGEEVLAGHGYVAPGDYHMLVSVRRGRPIIELDHGPKMHGVRPAADVTMASAAEVWGDRVVGVVLTGIGNDGCIGAKEIKKRGGIVIAQDESTSIVWGMPKSVVEAGLADIILPLHRIGPYLNRLIPHLLEPRQVEW